MTLLRILYATLALSLLTAGCGASNIRKAPATDYVRSPSASAIAAVHLDVGLPKPISLRVDPTSAAGKHVVTKVMRWLHAAKRSGSRAVEVPWSAQQDEHTLTVLLRNGETLTIASDLRTNDSFVYVPSSTVILVGLPSASQLERYYDPSLAKWLWTGWRHDLTSHLAAETYISRHQAIFYASMAGLWVSRSNPTLVQATMETAKAAGNEVGHSVVSLLTSNQTMVWLVLFQGPYHSACSLIPHCRTLPDEVYYEVLDAKTGQFYGYGTVVQVLPQAQRAWMGMPTLLETEASRWQA